MRRIVCVLLCGVLSEVWGKDCLLSDFLSSDLYDSKFDTSGMQESYESGRATRVSCVIGHTGFFKLSCDDGTWTSRGTKCRAKRCGHPGEAQFADFRLVGDDFVFGSKVIYTCSKGYQMVSRINFRRCVDEGWDGFVPVCEPVQCPLLRLETNVLVTGNLEQANFGSVLRFGCKSGTEILDGPAEIFCDETGRWSGPPPTCKGVSCEAPIIENGQVFQDDIVYPEHHVLNFKCDDKYQPSEAVHSKCTKIGFRSVWSPRPTCELIRCKLNPSGIMGTTFEPSSYNVFSPGDSLTVNCGGDYWIMDKHTTTAVSTCKPNGKWSIEPKCLKVNCPNHRPKEVTWWQMYSNQRAYLGDQVRYQCSRGLHPTNDVGKLTCTRDGWKPDPPCQDRTCRAADVQNASPVQYRWTYNFNEEETFVCISGKRLRSTLTCTPQGWSGPHPCPRSDIRPVENPPTPSPGLPPCPKPTVNNGFVVQTKDVAYFTCNQGFKLYSGATWGQAECLNSMWMGLEHCIDRKVCNNVPEVPNADIKLVNGATVYQDLCLITCRDGRTSLTSHLICLNGTWDSQGIPIEKICPNRAKLCDPPPQVKDAAIITPYQKEYQWNSNVTYGCRDKFTLQGQNWSQCQSGKWKPGDINCTAFCFKPEEKQPTMTFIPDQERYLPGEVLEYQCVKPGKKAGGNVTCLLGSWSQPVDCEVKTCGTPEDIPNGYYDPVQDSETTIQYYCNEGFEMVSRVTTRMCFHGIWTNRVPVCEAKTCNLPPLNEAMIVSNMPEREDRVPQGHQLHFSCKLPGKVLKGSSDLVCGKDGGWGKEFPTCEDVSCDVVVTDSRLRVSGLMAGEAALRQGEKVRFYCEEGFSMIGTQETECLPTGKLSESVPTCSETCKLTDIGDSVHLESHALGASVQVGEKVTFRCRIRGHYLLGKKEVMCQPGGTWKDPFPTCGAGAQNCKSPPMLQDGDVKESQDSEYRHMQQVEMMCQRYYIIEGGPTKTCVNGEWEGEMRCLKPCTVDRTAMNKHKIRFRYSYDNKLYSQHNETIEFLCKDFTLPENPRRVCKDGHIELPTCM